MANLPKNIIKHPSFRGVQEVLDKNNVPAENAVDFVNQTNDVEKGSSGATMDLETGKVYKSGEKGKFEGDEGHVVGAEPSKLTDDRVVTHLYGAGQSKPRISLKQFAGELDRVKRHTGGTEGNAIGSWFDIKEAPDSGIQIDASRVIKDPAVAGHATVDRDEWGSWDLKKGRYVGNATWRRLLKRPGEINPADKSELRVPEQAKPGTSEFEDK